MFGFHLIQWIVYKYPMSSNMPDFCKQHLLGKSQVDSCTSSPSSIFSGSLFFFMTQNAWEGLWVLSSFLWEAHDLSDFFSLRSIPPPKKKREIKEKLRSPANLSLKKSWHFQYFQMTPTLLGRWKSLQKLHRNRPIVRPLRIWNSRWPTRKSRKIWSEKTKRYNNLDLPVLKCRKKCVNSPWHLRGKIP